MMITHGEQHSLISWLISQERVLRLWIDEVVGSASSDVEFVRKLEEHRTWLSDRIDELREQAA